MLKTGYVIGPSSHSEASFKYTVGDTVYENSSSGSIEDDCRRCLVKFAVRKAEVCQFYNHVCIPDEVEAAPAEGWREPPFPVPEYVQE